MKCFHRKLYKYMYLSQKDCLQNSAKASKSFLFIYKKTNKSYACFIDSNNMFGQTEKQKLAFDEAPNAGWLI